MRVCSKCKEEKDEDQFNPDRPECKDCRRSRNQMYYQKNKEKIDKKNKENYHKRVNKSDSLAKPNSNEPTSSKDPSDFFRYGLNDSLRIIQLTSQQ